MSESKKSLNSLPEKSSDFSYHEQNELVFRQSLLDLGITSETLSRAKAQLVPPPGSQIEEHIRLYELLRVPYLIKERHLENSPAARIFETVMKLYIQVIPELVTHWN